MKITFDERTFRIIFYACYFALAFGIACAILSAYTMAPGEGNVLMEGMARGSGTSDFDLQSTGQDARVAAHQSIGVDERYKFTQLQGTEYSASTSTLDVEISIDRAGGTEKTMYVYRQKNKDAGEVIRINNIVGTFKAESHGALTVSADGALSYDLAYQFNGKNLSYDAQAIIMDARTGRPATNLRVQRVGNWSIWNHLNVTTPIVTPESWLGSCEDMNKDILNDPTIPDSIFIMPKNDSVYNYYAKGKKIYRQLNVTE